MASTGPAARMSDEEKFFFDLNGFLHVRGALSKDLIDRMNEAITAHSSEIKECTGLCIILDEKWHQCPAGARGR